MLGLEGYQSEGQDLSSQMDYSVLMGILGPDART